MSSISVVIPNYNHGSYLPRLLERIFTKQSLQPLEVIIVDDASTDDSREILDEEKRRWPSLILHHNQQNQGVSISSNTGADIAQGEFLVFRAADDFELPGYYKSAAKLLEEHSSAAICCGDIDYFGRDENLRQTERLALSETPKYIAPEALPTSLSEQPLYGHATMIRKTAFHKAGGFDPQLAHLADWFCFLVAAFREGLCYLPQPVVASMLSHQSFGNLSAGRNQANAQLYQRLCEKLESDWSDIVEPLVVSPVLRFLGSPFESWLSNLPNRSLLHEKLKLSLLVQSTLKPLGGFSGVIDETLQRNKDSLLRLSQSKRGRIALYGAGSQTKAVLANWRSDILPTPQAILVNEPPNRTKPMLEGIDIVSLNQWKGPQPSLIILCSKSFEGLFQRLATERFPDAAILSFWDRTLTSL